MIIGIVPARPDDRTSRDTQYRLIPQIQVIAIVSIIAVDATCAGANTHICPSGSIIAHKDTIIDIPRLIMIDKRGGALRDGLATIIGTVHKRGSAGIVVDRLSDVCCQYKVGVYIGLFMV